MSMRLDGLALSKAINLHCSLWLALKIITKAEQ